MIVNDKSKLNQYKMIEKENGFEAVLEKILFCPSYILQSQNL